MRNIEKFLKSRDPSLPDETYRDINALIEGVYRDPSRYETNRRCIDILANNLPGSHRLFEGLAELFGTENYGGSSHGAAANIFIHSITEAEPIIRDALIKKLRGLPTTEFHNYRDSDIQQVLGAVRNCERVRTPLAEFQSAFSAQRWAEVYPMLHALQVDLKKEGLEQGDYEYLESQVKLFLPELVSLCSMYGRAKNTEEEFARATSLSLFSNFLADLNYGDRFGAFLIESLSDLAQRTGDGGASAATALHRIRKFEDGRFEVRLLTAYEDCRDSIAIHPLIAATVSGKMDDANGNVVILSSTDPGYR